MKGVRKRKEKSKNLFYKTNEHKQNGAQRKPPKPNPTARNTALK